MRKPTAIAAVATVIAAALAAAPAPAVAATTVGVSMYRLYNPNSGEHFYTADINEESQLASLGWCYEGAGWTAPVRSNTPVYRLYNPNAGDHHYTTSATERDSLMGVGWRYEGIGWYSNDARTVPLYRQYNPNAVAGSHNYTCERAENDQLVRLGWRYEGIGWYGLRGRWIPARYREYTLYECAGCDFQTESEAAMEAHQHQAGKDHLLNGSHSEKINFYEIPMSDPIPGTGVFEYE